MVSVGLRWFQMVSGGPKWSQMVPNGLRWSQMVCLRWFLTASYLFVTMCFVLSSYVSSTHKSAVHPSLISEEGKICCCCYFSFFLRHFSSQSTFHQGKHLLRGEKKDILQCNVLPQTSKTRKSTKVNSLRQMQENKNGARIPRALSTWDSTEIHWFRMIWTVALALFSDFRLI